MASKQDLAQIKMRYAHALTIVATIACLAACKTDAVRADVPARITNPTADSRAELLRVVRSALDGRDVTIADDALTTDSLLIIEPAHLTGRDLGRAEHFRLVLSGSSCILLHQESDSRLELTDTGCAAE